MLRQTLLLEYPHLLGSVTANSNKKRRAGARLLFFVLAGVFGLTVLLWWALQGLASHFISIDVSAASYRAEVSEVSEVYSADGKLLSRFAAERRTYVPLDQIAPTLPEAVLAVEDDGFYQHEGISYLSILRALLANVRSGDYRQGGSTISQQVARALYLSSEKRLSRKLMELLLAKRLDEELSKKEILEIYLNTIYWGGGSWGAQEAARTYFCRQASELDLAQSLMLAGIISAPERFSPLKNPDLAQSRFYHARRRLNQGRQEKGLPPTDVAFPQVEPCPRLEPDFASYATRRIRNSLSMFAGKNAVEKGGYRILLTIDSSLQGALETALQDSLAEGILAKLAPGVVIAKAAPAPLEDCRIEPGRQIWARVKEIGSREARLEVKGFQGRLALSQLVVLHGAGRTVDISRDDWLLVTPDEELDLCSPWTGDPPIFLAIIKPQLAIVLMDESSRVLAYTGGLPGTRSYWFDRAFDASRNIGSTMKPFIYLAAVIEWGWRARTRIPADLVAVFKDRDGKPWLPEEHGPDFRETNVSLGNAIWLSLNRPAVAVANALGTEKMKGYFKRFGLPVRKLPDLSFALGNYPMSPAELASAYTLFFGRGNTYFTSLVSEIRDRFGNVVFQSKPVLKGRVDAGDSDEILRILGGVVSKGTGTKAAIEGVKVAGKTGTGPEGKDAWFVGRAGPYIAVVWVGNDDYSAVKGSSGPDLAAPLFAEVMSRVLKAATPEKPPGATVTPR